MPRNDRFDIRLDELKLKNDGYGESHGKVSEVWRKVRSKYLNWRGPVRLVRTVFHRVFRSTWEFVFFGLPRDLYSRIGKDVVLELEVFSRTAQVTVNAYRHRERYEVEQGIASLVISRTALEVGENVLAYKGKCRLRRISFKEEMTNGRVNREVRARPVQDNSPITRAVAYLCSSVVRAPKESPLAGSCYTIYDYDNGCYRMPAWLWSDAPVVSALLELSGRSEEKNAGKYRSIAERIGDVLLSFQVTDPEHPQYGALVSRYRYYANTSWPFDCLLGPNDASFIVKWALMPLYRYTGRNVYRARSKIALDWIERTMHLFDYLPSHYYNCQEKWENGGFVDSGFTPEGFLEYDTVSAAKVQAYIDSAIFFMHRFMSQFKLESGFYGRYFDPQSGTNPTIFTRGQAWVLEGLISTYAGTQKPVFLDEAIDLARLIVSEQNQDGSWAYLLGETLPCETLKTQSGICEKATAILGYLLLKLHGITGDTAFFRTGTQALDWCQRNMCLDRKSEGYGGIMGRSQNSGIIGLPYITVATGYANAFYVMGKLLLDRKRDLLDVSANANCE